MIRTILDNVKRLGTSNNCFMLNEQFTNLAILGNSFREKK
jgi:hypothetical protein